MGALIPVKKIIVLVREVKYPMIILDTVKTTALSTKNKKDPITVMIQTK